jgi:hypothetical protein
MEQGLSVDGFFGYMNGPDGADKILIMGIDRLTYRTNRTRELNGEYGVVVYVATPHENHYAQGTTVIAGAPNVASVEELKEWVENRERQLE